uniref:En/Spm-like transposon protein n=1 Tax=Arabidopsis thaliana TaxID=3702 RepID=Q9SIG2_ARATH|nr:En/Spm-like transposon protein [Arabidopsis thaliana]
MTHHLGSSRRFSQKEFVDSVAAIGTLPPNVDIDADLDEAENERTDCEGIYMGQQKKKRGKSNKKKVNAKNANDEVEYIGTIEPQVNDEEHVEPAEVQVSDADQVADLDQVIDGDQVNDEDHLELDQVADPDQVVDGDSDKGDVYVEPKRKRHRGPIRLKDIAKDPNARVRVEFANMGETIGKGSVKLASYVGALVREHVPVTIERWSKIGEELRTVLWKSVQAKFELDEEYQKKTANGDPSEVTRLKVWVKSRTKKDGTPVNTNVAEKIKKVQLFGLDVF